MKQHQNILSATCIGSFANRILKTHSMASVSGISSKGIYLQTSNDGMIFLSFEAYRGPLTINLPASNDDLLQIETGGIVKLKPTYITLPQDSLQINTGDVQVWKTPEPIQEVPVEVSLLRVNEVIDHLALLLNGEKNLSLLKSVFENHQVQNQNLPGFELPLSQFLKSLDANHLRNAERGLMELVGLGPGLTPVGDDFILGVLLILNRWKQIFRTHQNLDELNKSLLDHVKSKSTSLSYNLLICASKGSGDERLLNMIDGFFSKEDAQIQNMTHLLSWGYSSGIAVLAGAVSVLTRLIK